MTLRLKINLIVGALTLLFVATMIGLELRAAKDSVHEETVAANRVAAQLLDRTAWRYAAQGTPAMLAFLQGVGRIRSNDILLFDTANQELYRSPPSPYKAGRDAPDWFSRLISPPASMRSIQFPDGRLEVHANASRAVLDAWDELAWLAGGALGMLALVNGLVFWGVGRAVRPFGRIVTALDSLQAGRFDVVLPPLPGREAAAIGSAFNRMTAQLQQHIETEKRAVRAERQLSDSRALTRWIEQHIEQERRLIARELHDELGQSVTAMRSMALSIAQRSATQASEHPALAASLQDNAQAAQLIADEASRLYDAMHGIIPRLTPLVLDSFGLAEALADLAERSRVAHPALALTLQVALGDAPLSPEAALALYRAAQEGLTNALRHGRASAVTLALQADAARLTLTVSDNGVGPPADAAPADEGHYGLRWLAERAQALGGQLQLLPQQPHGALLRVQLPLDAAAATANTPPPPALAGAQTAPLSMPMSVPTHSPPQPNCPP
ncbi:MAG: methanol utilization protein MoxY [Burkholderiales bacterium PBB5]|nr:MAG: methanol utilization protein MoxY [Burkholderiales bacterium PBB5]